MQCEVLVENDKLKITQMLFTDSFETDSNKYTFESYVCNLNIKLKEVILLFFDMNFS